MGPSATLEQTSVVAPRAPVSGVPAVELTTSSLSPPLLEPAGGKRSRIGGILIFILSVIAVVCVGVGDFFSAPDATSSILYLLPVSLAAWYSGRVGGLIVALLAATIWFLAEKYHVTPARTQFIFLLNAFSRLAVFLYVVIVIYHLHKNKADLEETVRERTQKLHLETAQRLAVQGEIAAISDREQERIGHELHDGLCQYLTGIGFRAKALEQQLCAANSSHIAEARELSALVGDAIRQARNLARGLDPIELQNGDLIAALQGLTAEIEKVFQVSCSFEHRLEGPRLELKRPAALALYRICQEATNNAIKHGAAQKVQILLTELENFIRLEVTDNGRGLPLHAANAFSTGMGIRIMHFRAESIGGSLSIMSSPGQGTTIICSAPRLLIAAPASNINNHSDVRPTSNLG